jgi:hypothetical protein
MFEEETVMKKKIIKMKQYCVIALLVVVSIALVGLIYSAGQKTKNDQLVVASENQANEPIVDEIDYEVIESKSTTNDSDDEITSVKVEDIISDDQNEEDGSPKVIVESIDINEDSNTEVSVIDVDVIDVPVSEEPEKPDMTPPEDIPETTDDLTDPDNVPEYNEDETTYTPEPEVEEVEDEVRGSNLVPDSENPFLQDNIPGNGDGGEMMGEDYYEDGVPSGEGDKF